MRLLIIILGGIIGAKLFSKVNNEKTKNQENPNLNDFWYKYNNPILKNNIRYNNHCWNCKRKIDSYYEMKCSVCGWYICSKCGSCSKYPNCEKRNR